MESNELLDLQEDKYLEEFLLDLEELETLILKLNDEGTRKEILRKINRSVHSLKGTSGSYGFSLLSVACHRIEDQMYTGQIQTPEEMIDNLLHEKDNLERICKAYQLNDKDTLRHFNEKLSIIGTQEKSPDLYIVAKNPKTNAEQKQNQIVSSGKLRVLIGESSELLTGAYLRALTGFDVEVSKARDGYELLGRLLREKFDILITSLYLPTVDAVSLFKILDIFPNTNSALRTIVVTSSKDQALKIKRPQVQFLEKKINLDNDMKQALKKWVQPKGNPGMTDFESTPRRIFVVDDSPDIHNLITASLKKNKNVTLGHCHDPVKAVEQAIEFKPDLIFLDVQMPELTGDQVMAMLKATGKFENCLFAFLTGTDDPNDLAKLAALNPNAIMRKPFVPKLLMQNIQKIFEGKAA